MVDIHCHILPGIDDGCKTMEDTLSLLKDAENLGFTDICFSPHYVKGSRFSCNNIEKKNLLEEVKKMAQDNNIGIKLYLGNEVCFENNLNSLIDNDEASTINGGRYLLFELPMVSEVNNLKDVIFDLKVKGFIPIIAHPERYEVFQKDPNKMIPLINQGCLFQANFTSLVGVYGKEACKSIKTMLKHNLIHFLATDVHHPNSKNYSNLSLCIKQLDDLIDKNYIDELINKNPLSAINDVEFKIREPKEIKKKHFFF